MFNVTDFTFRTTIDAVKILNGIVVEKVMAVVIVIAKQRLHLRGLVDHLPLGGRLHKHRGREARGRRRLGLHGGARQRAGHAWATGLLLHGIRAERDDVVLVRENLSVE